MKVTGRWVSGCYKWLKEEDQGCCHLVFDESELHEVCVVIGWHQYDKDDWRIAWKIGQQSFNNGMQTDFDIDFEMPYNTEAYCEMENARLKAQGKYDKYNRCEVGDVWDTTETIELKDGVTTPCGYRDWNALAAYIRKTARKVAKGVKEVDALEVA
jgi:hypothetical protein